jgi:hypothetical protein
VIDERVPCLDQEVFAAELVIAARLSMSPSTKPTVRFTMDCCHQSLRLLDTADLVATGGQ